MASITSESRIFLGVSGGIAAYKVVELVRQIRKTGARVDVAMSESASQFVGPLTFESLTRRPVLQDVFQQWTEAEAGHVTLAELADIFIVAPATANTIAKLAHGLADDMLSVSALACPAPVLVAPAMDHHMYLHPATQANLDTLRERGVHIVGPEEGELASGIIGQGRLASTEQIFGTVRMILGRNGPLAGRDLVVSSGATRESIDPIRFISNRATGRMGHAIAQAAIDAGSRVTLISGPTHLPTPVGAKLVAVESAHEMTDAVRDAVRGADALIMAAAVGDYEPVDVACEKIKKSGSDIAIQLRQTVDILASTPREGLIKVGFAAETSQLEGYARGKLESKGVDLLVANDARDTMGSDENEAMLFRPGEEPERLPRLTKPALAERLIAEIVDLLATKRG